jgi:hypothetical protein
MSSWVFPNLRRMQGKSTGTSPYVTNYLFISLVFPLSSKKMFLWEHGNIYNLGSCPSIMPCDTSAEGDPSKYT